MKASPSLIHVLRVPASVQCSHIWYDRLRAGDGFMNILLKCIKPLPVPLTSWIFFPRWEINPCKSSSSEPFSWMFTSHDRAGFGLGLMQTRHWVQLRSAGHVWRSLGSPGGLVAFDVLVLVDAGQCGHMENVPHAVFWLERRTLDVRSWDLFGHVWTL